MGGLDALWDCSTLGGSAASSWVYFLTWGQSSVLNGEAGRPSLL